MSIVKHKTVRRSGVTILEVLFAIFVVIVGLLGIASIIPLAARNASDSNNHNNAQALGQRWFQNFFAFGLTEHDAYTSSQVGYNWQWFRDYTSASGAGPQFENFEKNYAMAPPAVRSRIDVLPSTNQSPSHSAGSATAISRVWGHQAVCIDPHFFTESDVRIRVNNAATRVGGYRLAVFPYFEDGYNPVTDPYAPSDPWHDQPRMLRATLGFATGSQVSRKLVDEIFASPDDVSVASDQTDKTIPATRIYDATLAKAIATGEYSWLATVSPKEPRSSEIPLPAAVGTTDDYLISLVVMHRRDKQFVTAGTTPSPGNSLDKPAGERLLWVYPLSGDFSGGNGGRVRLIANGATDDNLHIGDWIMLGKHYLIDPTDTSRRYAFYRWYRIIAVDEKPKLGLLQNLSPTGTDPYGNGAGLTVWSRDVVLEGPDWTFYSTKPIPPATTPAPSETIRGIPVPTTGTLMSGVVTVVERSMNVQ